MHSRLGVFLSPLHDPTTDPHLALRRDVALVKHLDELNFDECWFGEHHSLGWPLSGAPETLIAACAAVTSQIRLASGVVTVPFHHPFHIATRAIALDHLTRGRYILGVGPGATPMDAEMLGIAMADLKPRLNEALPAIMELINGDDYVSLETSWFELHDAKMQMPRYSPLVIELAISSVGSPNGPETAGRHGLGLLSFGAPPPGWPDVDLARQWQILEDSANASAQPSSRSNWRIAVPVHIAETRKQAFAEARYGFGRWLHNYWEHGVGSDIGMQGVDDEHRLEAMVDAGRAIVGSPEDASNAIKDLEGRSGGFGTFLAYAVNWAPWEATKRSYELLATEVAPHLNSNTQRGMESVNRRAARMPT